MGGFFQCSRWGFWGFRGLYCRATFLAGDCGSESHRENSRGRFVIWVWHPFRRRCCASPGAFRMSELPQIAFLCTRFLSLWRYVLQSLTPVFTSSPMLAFSSPPSYHLMLFFRLILSFLWRLQPTLFWRSRSRRILMSHRFSSMSQCRLPVVLRLISFSLIACFLVHEHLDRSLKHFRTFFRL